MTIPQDGSTRSVNVSGGTVNGIIQTGDNSQADMVQHVGVRATETPELAQLRQAVEELRLQLRAFAPGELPPGAAADAESALAEMEEALPSSDEADEPARGRVRRAFYAVSGALASVAALTEAVETLRRASAPWF
ncbi:DUF5955 family protein [Streptomyces sp. NPDC057429]|uniref:DUF5955 family protein n=1 Tax=Streptomyces sp. NPDC057429 TaxID=3346130 RepID=UPI00367ECB34